MSNPFATLTMIKVPFYKPAIEQWPAFEEIAKSLYLSINDKQIELKIVEENDVIKALSLYGIKPWPPILYCHTASGRTAKMENYVTHDAITAFLTEQITLDS